MRFPALVPALLAATAVGASWQGAISFRPKEGDKLTSKVVADLDLNGLTAHITSDLITETKKVTETEVQQVTEMKDLKLELDGQPNDAQASDLKVTLGPKMEPKSVEGGIDGSDPAQWLIVQCFVPPVGKEIKDGMQYTVEVPEVKDKIPAYTFDGAYLGTDMLDGKVMRKFKGVFKVNGADALSGEQTAWVRDDGVVAKLTCKFKSMDVPVAGRKADGTISIVVKNGGSE